MCLYYLIKHTEMKDCSPTTHTHTHTHTYVYTLKILFVIKNFPRHIHLKKPDLLD